MASGRPPVPCFLALGICEQVPSPLHKESCAGREMTVLQAPPPRPPPAPSTQASEQTDKSSCGGCGLSV